MLKGRAIAASFGTAHRLLEVCRLVTCPRIRYNKTTREITVNLFWQSQRLYGSVNSGGSLQVTDRSGKCNCTKVPCHNQEPASESKQANKKHVVATAESSRFVNEFEAGKLSDINQDQQQQDQPTPCERFMQQSHASLLSRWRPEKLVVELSLASKQERSQIQSKHSSCPIAATSDQTSSQVKVNLSAHQSRVNYCARRACELNQTSLPSEPSIASSVKVQVPPTSANSRRSVLLRAQNSLINKMSFDSLSSSSSGSSINSFSDGQTTGAYSQPAGHKMVKFNACGQLYSDLSKTRPIAFASAPAGRGIDFEMTYFDSLDLIQGAPSVIKTVCVLHGAPGSSKDFDSLINELTALNVRVIAPDLPKYDVTFEYSFRHSPSERVEILKNFFQTIGVNQIDLLVGHSSAIYTVFELLEQNLELTRRKDPKALRIKSIGLFNTPTYNLPPSMTPTPIRMLMLHLFDFPLFRPLITALINGFVKVQGIVNQVDKNRIDDLLIAASAMTFADSDNMRYRLKLIRRHRIPAFILIGSRDKLIPVHCFEQLKTDLGVKSDQVRHYGLDGELVADVAAGSSDDLVDVSQFSSGGHYTFRKFSKQVNEDLYRFLLHKTDKPPLEPAKY